MFIFKLYSISDYILTQRNKKIESQNKNKNHRNPPKKLGITADNSRYTLQPEVTRTPGSGCFGLSHTDTQTHGHCD